MKIIIILISLFSFHSLFGQDTLEIEDRKDFDEVIWKSYINLYGDRLGTFNKSSIDSIFRTYNFEDSIYNCQYFLSFRFELDSCGSIIRCEPARTKKKYVGKVLEFQTEVRNWILNEAKPISNYCVVDNKSYFQLGSYLLDLEISCEPRELLFRENNAHISTGTVFKYQTDHGPIYFSGYSNFCDEP